MKARFWPLACVVFGLATLGVTLAFSQLPDVKAAYPGDDFSRAMNAFQRAETPADLAAIFRAPADPAILEAMRAANQLDLWVYIAAYSLFLIAGAAMLAGGLRRPIVWLAIVPTLLGAGGDVVETITQLRIVADYAQADALLPVATWFWLKFFGLALGAFGTSAICLIARPRHPIIAALGVIPILATLALWLKADTPPLMTGAFGVFWVGLLVLAILSSVRPESAPSTT
ncbi:MAG: hypothetical protein WDM79_12440 [Terricaulis sp.]